MIQNDYRNTAALTAAAIAGQAAGSALLGRIAAGNADTDELFRQVTAPAGDLVALRSFCRTCQKHLERGAT